MSKIISGYCTIPLLQASGAPAGCGQALPAGHAVQFSNLPPSENIPVGHGTGGLLKRRKYFLSVQKLYICYSCGKEKIIDKPGIRTIETCCTRKT